MNSFKIAICQLMADSLRELDPEQDDYSIKELERLIERPPKQEMGDYAFPCFTLSRSFRKSPSLIAKTLVSTLQSQLSQHKALTGVYALGPYINFRVSLSLMASLTLPRIANGEFFKYNERRTLKTELQPRIMIEFSQPNTHKGFHMGHMRNIALGDSLCRIFRYNGYEIVAANYIGDSGAHIAKCLWYYLNYNQEPVPENLRGEWLGVLYMKAEQKIADATEEDRKNYLEEAGLILQLMEAKESEITKTWQETRQWSLDDFESIYQWLDVRFDEIFFESQFDEEGKQIVFQELQKRTFERSKGAIGINLETADLGFFLLLKSDGNTLYATKDLALAKRKFDEFHIDRSIYVVGSEQNLHFKQVFETLKRMGYEQARQCIHLSYGLVSLPSGKMSSRTGNVFLFSRLQKKMKTYIQENYLDKFRGEWHDDEIEETTRRVSVAAIKYGMLNQDAQKPIVFAMEDWLVSEGDTGTYLIYAYVRIRSITRKLVRKNNPDQLAVLKVSTDVDFNLLLHPNEQELIRLLYDFNDTVWAAGEQFRPSMIARMLFDLAKIFSRAYTTCSVLHAESPSLQEARLLLFHCVAEALKEGMFLLGITPPERM